MLSLVRNTIQSALDCFGYKIVLKDMICTKQLGVDPLHDMKVILSDQNFHPHLSTNSIKVIFDIGANTGQTAIQLTKTFPKARVFSFEPIKSTYEELVLNTSGFNNINTFQLGFGKTSETRTIYIYPHSVLASCVPESPMMSSNSSVDTSEINIESIDSFCSKQNVEKIDLLKIDTEGFDYEVIQGAERLLKERMISFVLFEFFYVGDDSQDNSGGRLIDMHNFLVRYNYRPVAFYTDGIHWKHTAGVYNTLYMKWQMRNSFQLQNKERKRLDF